jgi:uncharacterized membrane protein YozB (DUF420 family)
VIPLTHLPTLNAFLNGTSAVLLLLGYYFVKRTNIAAHKICMVSAFFSSTLFLISYLYYHAHIGSKHFEGIGLIRRVYFSILISHTLLAAAIVPMVLITIRKALKGDYLGHARIARWTWPIWMYVSVTGVVIYVMLYII